VPCYEVINVTALHCAMLQSVTHHSIVMCHVKNFLWNSNVMYHVAKWNVMIFRNDTSQSHMYHKMVCHVLEGFDVDCVL
jgi:hypothetical protein